MKIQEEVQTISNVMNDRHEFDELHENEWNRSLLKTDLERNMYGGNSDNTLKKVPQQENYLNNKLKTENIVGRVPHVFNQNMKGTAVKHMPVVMHQRNKNIYLSKPCKIPISKRKSEVFPSSNPSALVVLSERKMEIKNLESQVFCLKEKIKELKVENKTLTDIQARQEREIRKYETGIADIPSLMKDHKDEKKVLELNLTSVKNELKDCQKEVKLKQEALLKKNRQIEKLSMELKKCSLMKQNLGTEIQNLKSTCKKFEEENIELKSENEKLQRDIQLVKNYVAELKSNPGSFMNEKFEEIFSKIERNNDVQKFKIDASGLNKQDFEENHCTEKGFRQPNLDIDSKNELKEIAMKDNLSPPLMCKDQGNGSISSAKTLFCTKSSPKKLHFDAKDSISYPLINLTTISNAESSARGDSKKDCFLKWGNIFQDSKTASLVDCSVKESSLINSKEIKSADSAFQDIYLTVFKDTDETENKKDVELTNSKEAEQFLNPEYPKIGTSRDNIVFSSELPEKNSCKLTSTVDHEVDGNSSTSNDFGSTLYISKANEKYLHNSKIFDRYLKKDSWKFHS